MAQTTDTIASKPTTLELMARVDKLAASSFDRSTGIGAVLELATGETIERCNSLPDNILDTDARSERPAKYFYWEHAERNVIFQAAYDGLATAGSTLYTTGIPCADCARACIMAGVSEVVVWKQGSGLEGTSRWTDSINAGREMLEEAGIKITEVER